MGKIYNLMVHMVDQEDKLIFQKKITALPLREEVIIENSIKYFDDPEPCMIHRSAVMKRIYMEIQDFFLRELNQQPHCCLSWKEVPSEIRSYLELPKEVKYMEISQLA